MPEYKPGDLAKCQCHPDCDIILEIMERASTDGIGLVYLVKHHSNNAGVLFDYGTPHLVTEDMLKPIEPS